MIVNRHRVVTIVAVTSPRNSSIHRLAPPFISLVSSYLFPSTQTIGCTSLPIEVCRTSGRRGASE